MPVSLIISMTDAMFLYTIETMINVIFGVIR